MSQDKHDLKFAEILKLWIHGQDNLTQNLWSVVGRGEADKATNRLKR